VVDREKGAQAARPGRTASSLLRFGSAYLKGRAPAGNARPSTEARQRRDAAHAAGADDYAPPGDQPHMRDHFAVAAKADAEVKGGAAAAPRQHDLGSHCLRQADCVPWYVPPRNGHRDAYRAPQPLVAGRRFRRATQPRRHKTKRHGQHNQSRQRQHESGFRNQAALTPRHARYGAKLTSHFICNLWRRPQTEPCSLELAANATDPLQVLPSSPRQFRLFARGAQGQSMAMSVAGDESRP
jgi:hypothetical protein